MKDVFIPVEVAARLENLNIKSMQKRIKRGQYSEWAIRKESRSSGGFCYKISLDVLSVEAQALYNREIELEPVIPEVKERKPRSDSGKTKADDKLLLMSTAKINNIRVSSPKRLNRDCGFKEIYENYFLPQSTSMSYPIISYRQFVNLTKPFVDREIQALNNLGPVRYKNTRQLTNLCDYSVYEPMQFLQNDHTQFDCVCIHNGRIIRPWAAMHISAGDRIRSYPTIVERPDSYSLADNLMNFVLRNGISNQPTIYKADNGKAQKSRLMTKTGFKDIDLPPFNLEERHIEALKQMGIAAISEQGLIQNLGMIESETTARLPRAKMIERSFGVGGTMEWFKDRAEYTGRKYEEKPEQLERLIKRGRIWHSEEMIDFAMQKVDECNNRRHEGIHKECKGNFVIPHVLDLDLNYFQTDPKVLESLKGMIPESMSEVIRIFNDPEFARDLKTEIYSPMWRRRIWELCGWNSRPIPSKESLAMMILPYEERIVHSYGISINAQPYVSRELQPVIGQKVICRFSPSNIIRVREQSGKEKLFIQEVYVFRIIKKRDRVEEEFLCIAQPHEHVVTGIRPVGYAKTFLTARREDYKEITSAAKITSDISEGKEQESISTSAPIIQMNSFREQAARKMDNAIQEKKKNEKTAVILRHELEDKASRLYGKKIVFEES